jgi:hypothetical protein
MEKHGKLSDGHLPHLPRAMPFWELRLPGSTLVTESLLCLLNARHIWQHSHELPRAYRQGCHAYIPT